MKNSIKILIVLILVTLGLSRKQIMAYFDNTASSNETPSVSIPEITEELEEATAESTDDAPAETAEEAPAAEA